MDCWAKLDITVGTVLCHLRFAIAPKISGLDSAILAHMHSKFLACIAVEYVYLLLRFVTRITEICSELIVNGGACVLRSAPGGWH